METVWVCIVPYRVTDHCRHVCLDLGANGKWVQAKLIFMSDGAPWLGNQLVEDRRRTVRVPAQIEIRFRESIAAAKVFKAYSLNFSVGGMCLKTRRSYTVGTSLQLFIKIEDEEYRVSAVVAWKRGDAIGVRFKNVDDEIQQRFVALVESLQP